MRMEQRARGNLARVRGRPGLRTLAAGLSLALLAVAGQAHAAELAAHGPASCPDAEELTFRVERAIGMPLAAAAALRFAVTFEGGAGAYAAELQVDGGESRELAAARRFQAQDCSRLGDAVGLAIALALGAAAPGAPEPPLNGRTLASEPPGTPPARAAAQPSALPARAAAPSSVPRDAPLAPELAPARPVTVLLAAALVADSGSLPAAGLGLSVAAELRLARLALRVGGLLLLDQRAALPRSEQPAAGAELGLALGSVSLCSRALGSASTRLSAFFCGGWELGRLEGSGTGVPEPRRGSALWTAPRLEAQLAWAPLAGPVHLTAQLGAATPLKRDDFFLRDLGSVHRPPAVVGRAGVGLEVSFE